MKPIILFPLALVIAALERAVGIATADIAICLILDHFTAIEDRLFARLGVDSCECVVVNAEFQQFVELKMSRDISCQPVMVEGHGFNPTVAYSRIIIWDSSGELVVVQVQKSELDPPQTDVLR